MTNLRDTTNLRALHDDAACPASCPYCARIEAACDQEERGAKEYLTVFDYPEEYQ